MLINFQRSPWISQLLCTSNAAVYRFGLGMRRLRMLRNFRAGYCPPAFVRVAAVHLMGTMAGYLRFERKWLSHSHLTLRFAMLLRDC